MFNTYVLAGRLKHFHETDDCLQLMIGYSNADGDMVIPAHTKFKPRKELINYLEDDMHIGIKGYIDLDADGHIELVVEKLTIASAKFEEDEIDESNS